MKQQGFEVGDHDQCYACRMPLTQEEMQSEQYEAGISCPYCFDKLSAIKKSHYASARNRSNWRGYVAKAILAMHKNITTKLTPRYSRRLFL